MAPYFDFVSIPAFAVAWVVHMFTGMIWYHPKVFGTAFIRLAHRGKFQKPDPNAMMAAALGSAISLPFFSFMLSVAGCESAGEGALWGLGFGFFFDSGLNVSHGFFEDRPFPLFVLHRGYHTVSLTFIGAILGQLCGKRV